MSRPPSRRLRATCDGASLRARAEAHTGSAYREGSGRRSRSQGLDVLLSAADAFAGIADGGGISADSAAVSRHARPRQRPRSEIPNSRKPEA